jgi:hypothetical protein
MNSIKMITVFLDVMPSWLVDGDQPFSFGGGEGPRSRCYRRTAALRLIVQPCDEDEEKDGKSSP